MLLYGVDIKIAGSLSLAVSLPTMLVAVARYSRDNSFTVLAADKPFVLAMTAGSITGTLTGGLLLGVVPTARLIPLLVGAGHGPAAPSDPRVVKLLQEAWRHAKAIGSIDDAAAPACRAYAYAVPASKTCAASRPVRCGARHRR